MDGKYELSPEDYRLWKKHEENIKYQEAESIRHDDFNILVEKTIEEGEFDKFEKRGYSINCDIENYACIQSPVGVHVYLWKEREEECCGYCGEPEECK